MAKTNETQETAADNTTAATPETTGAAATPEATGAAATPDVTGAAAGAAAAPDTAGNPSSLNFQAEIGCILLNKELKAIMQKIGDMTIYAIIPRIDQAEDEGMEFGAAIDEIGEFIKGLVGLDRNPISKETVNGVLSAVISQPEALKLHLRQTYLFIKNAGKEKFCEYAFNISVDYNPEEQEQSDGVLFRVSKLAFTIWSCDKEIILRQMDLYDLSDMDKLLKDKLEGAEQNKLEENGQKKLAVS